MKNPPCFSEHKTNLIIEYALNHLYFGEHQCFAMKTLNMRASIVQCSNWVFLPYPFLSHYSCLSPFKSSELDINLSYKARACGERR